MKNHHSNKSFENSKKWDERKIFNYFYNVKKEI